MQSQLAELTVTVQDERTQRSVALSDLNHERLQAMRLRAELEQTQEAIQLLSSRLKACSTAGLSLAVYCGDPWS